MLWPFLCPRVTARKHTHTLVILHGLSSEVQHCSRNYSLTEEMSNLKVCG